MSDWKTPATVLGIAGTVLTAIGLYIGYVHNERNLEIERERIKFEQEERAAREAANKKEAIQKIDLELSSIDRQIQKCKSNIDSIQAVKDELDKVVDRPRSMRVRARAAKKALAEMAEQMKSLEEKRLKLKVATLNQQNRNWFEK